MLLRREESGGGTVVERRCLLVLAGWGRRWGEAEAETEAGSWSCGTGNAEEVVLAAEVAGTEVAGTAEAAVAAVVAAKEGQSWAVVVRTTTSERLLHS